MSLSHLRNINGYYYFRIRIPSDLVQCFDSQEIQRSIRTKKLSVAKSQCRSLASTAEYVFSQIRSGFLSEEQIHQLVDKHFPSRKKNVNKVLKPKLLSEVKRAYVNEYTVLGKWSDKTRLEIESALNISLEVIGNRALTAIDRQVMVDYLTKLQKLPANIKKSRKYRDLTVEQILDSVVDQPMSQRTVNKYVGRVSSLFIWCMRQGYMTWNPAEGLAVSSDVKEDEERKAYSLTDIEKIISLLGKHKNSSPGRYFVPLVAAYSGMRLNEICQLYVSDVKQVDGVWCFDINDDGDKRLKNKASRRVIPVHPKLIELGLLEHVDLMRETGEPRVWMNLECKRDGYSHDIGKWYQRFNRQHITTDRKKVFHSFRHLFCDTLKQKGVAPELISELVGHSNNHSITMSRYGKRYRPNVLLEVLRSLTY